MKPELELGPETIEGLTAFLADPARPKGTLSYTALRGYLFAVVNTPEMLVPSRWLGRIFGEDEMAFESEAQANETLGWIMTVWNDVGRISKDEKIVPAELFGAEDTEPVRREWSSGFGIGWEFVQEEWFERIGALSEKHREWFGLCQFCLVYFSDPERYHEEWEISEEGRETWIQRMNELFPSALEYYAKVAATLPRIRPSASGSSGGAPIRVEKGPGRNDPCPCGSGKKYKKCCLN